MMRKALVGCIYGACFGVPGRLCPLRAHQLALAKRPDGNDLTQAAASPVRPPTPFFRPKRAPNVPIGPQICPQNVPSNGECVPHVVVYS